MPKTKTIEERLRDACIDEAKANLSGAAKSLGQRDIEGALQWMGRAQNALVRADEYAAKVPE